MIRLINSISIQILNLQLKHFSSNVTLLFSFLQTFSLASGANQANLSPAYSIDVGSSYSPLLDSSQQSEVHEVHDKQQAISSSGTQQSTTACMQYVHDRNGIVSVLSYI